MLNFQSARLLKIRFDVVCKNLFKYLCLSFCLLVFFSSVRAQQCSAPPSAPSVSATAGPGYKEITLSINFPAFVNGADVYMSEDNGANFYVVQRYYYGPNGNYSYTRSSLDTNKTYQFYVVGGNNCGSTSSEIVSATTRDIDVASISAATGSNYKEITVSLSIPDGIDVACIFMSEDNGANFYVVQRYYYGPNGNYSYTRSSLDTNKTYQFYVEVYSGNRLKRSGIVSATTRDIDAPSISAATGSRLGEINISINIPDGIDNAFVYMSSDNWTTSTYERWYSKPPKGDYFYTRSSLETNKTYQFNVSVQSGLREKWSNIASATTRDIDAPSISAATGSRLGEINVSINIPDGIDNAFVYKSSDNWTTFTNEAWYSKPPKGNYFFTISNLDTNKTYQFNVLVQSGSREKWSNIASVSLNTDQDAGASSCNMTVGKPVNVTNGNMYLQQTDYNLPGVGESINVTRTYNSIIQFSGLFGYGWATQYDENIVVQNGNVLRLALPDGRAVYFTRSAAPAPFLPSTPDFYGQIVSNADNTFTLTYKDGRVHEFSSGGKLLRQTDRNGDATTLTYDTNGNLAAITDSFGRTLTVTTNLGYVTQIGDGIGAAANYLYNADGTLQSVTYADGSKYKFEYVAINNKIYLTTVKDALNNILETHQYDSTGRATTSEKHGGVEKYTLDYSNPAYTTVTDALGGITKYYFEIRGRAVVTKIEGGCNCGSGAQLTNFEYDNRRNLTKKTDGNGHVSTYTYDAAGNRLTSTDSTGTRTFTYNGYGQALTAADQMNGTMTVAYNAAGSPTEIRDALGNTTNLAYNPKGQVVSVTDARNKTTALTWTGANLTKQTDANAKETDFLYDGRGRLQTVTDALAQVTAYQYDLNNRVKKIIYPDTKFEEFTYDLAGRQTNARDARGNTTTFGYDSAYRPVSVTDALSHTTTFGYDLMSNRTSVTDALNQTTNYEYDNFNRLKKTIYPEIAAGGIRLNEQLFYDAAGNLKKRTDTAGRDTLYDYDDANRLVKTTDANLQITQFQYNGRSQMTKVTDALNQIYDFTFDPLGRQMSQTRAGSTMSYEYDAVGNRTKRVDYTGRETNYVYDNLNRLTNIDYQGSTDNAVYGYDELSRLTSAVNQNGTVSFAYDNRSRLKTSTDVFNHTVEYGYDESGNRNLLKLDNAVHSTYAYDAANRLTGLTDDANQNFAFGYDNANRLRTKTLPNNVQSTYNYDGMNRLTELKHQSQATLVDNNYGYNAASQINQITELAQTKNFGYDNVDRLTSATYTNPSQANETYAFDSVGNRNLSHLSSVYSYQANNKLISTQTGIYGYDANGNMTSKSDASGSWGYGWDFENRMTSASNVTNSVLYAYDALGRRVKRVDPAGNITKFTYDGLDVVMDDDSVSGITKYQNGLGIDDKLELTNGTDTKYFLQDHLGSTNGLTDSSGNLTSQTNYDSFGNATNQSFTTRYQFTGREYDNFTGLTYYRARWYDGNLGRFISEDPIGLAGGINQYGYVKNSPLNFTDSLGLTQDGPTNYLRDPLSPEHWIANGLSNSVSDLLGLDSVAQWSWTAGDYRCSTSDRVGSAAKLGGWTAFQAFGGYAAGKVFGAAFKALRPLLRRTPNTALLNEGGIYAFGLKNNVVDFAEGLGANHLMNDPNWKSTFAEIINNSANKIHFNLNGIDEPIMKMINTPSRSGINWEMNQLYQSPAFESTTFYYGDSTYIGFSVFQIKP